MGSVRRSHIQMRIFFFFSFLNLITKADNARMQLM